MQTTTFSDTNEEKLDECTNNLATHPHLFMETLLSESSTKKTWFLSLSPSIHTTASDPCYKPFLLPLIIHLRNHDK